MDLISKSDGSQMIFRSISSTFRTPPIPWAKHLILMFFSDGECCLKDMDFDPALGNPFHPPSGKCQFVMWCTALPLNVCFYFTIPDVRKTKCRKWYPLSFFVCIIWIAVTSYVLVWMVTVIGFTFGLPDTVMGLTLVAFGSSVPDCISSLVVAKKGE